jgi:uncharacterized repeat protein (TIGR02543 family)
MKAFRTVVVIIGMLAAFFAGVGGLSSQQADAAAWSFIDDGGISADSTAYPQSPSTAVHNGALYVAWYESLSSPPSIKIRSYNGSTWSAVTTVVGDPLLPATNRPALASYNGNLYLAYTAPKPATGPAWDNTRIRVKKFDGATWSDANNNDYNIDTSICSDDNPCNSPPANINHVFNLNATSPSLLAANGKLYASWLEYPNSIPSYNIRVAEFDGATWHMIDGGANTGLNYAGSKDADQNVSPLLAWFNGKLYVGWDELNSRQELRIKEYNPSGGTWAFVDGGAATGLNYDTTNPNYRDALNPHLATLNGALYAFWAEATYHDSVWGADVIGIRYKRFNGTAWSDDGSSDGRSLLSFDITLGSDYPNTVASNNLLYTAWNESAEVPSLSGVYLQQQHVASFDGTSRTMIDGNIATGLNGTATNAAYGAKLAVFNGDLYGVWRETNESTPLHNWIRVKKLPLPPYVTSVTAPADGTYETGSNLDFTVTFNKAVTVTGTPYLPVTLDTGGTVQAVYQSGSGTSSLHFRYTVTGGVADTNGVTVGSALNANGGTLLDLDGNNANLTLNSVASTAAVLVDGMPLTVTYDGNGKTGGSVPTDGNGYFYGATVTVLANTGSLVRTGYTFAGWNTAANGSGTDYAASGSATFTMGIANVTLYAMWTINHTLTVNFAGDGVNKVESTSPDQNINCLKGSTDGCSAGYAAGTAVTLKATADWKSTFMGWSGDYVSSDNPGTVTMNANKTVTATFDPNNKAKLIPGGALFASIQEAYSSVPSGSMTIQAQTWSFLEDLLFSNGTTVTLTGGMDESYNPTSGYATVKSLTVGTGSAVIGNITIK